MIFRDETSGRDLRLSQAEAQEALRLYDSVVNDGRGRIIFISGEDGSGKSDILQVLPETLRRVQPQPLVIAGRFRDGNYFPWDIGKEKPFPTDEVLAASGESLAFGAQVSDTPSSSTITPLIPPNIKYAGELIAQLLQALGATRQFLGKYKGQPRRSFSRDDFKDLFRYGLPERPLICLFDDLHKASLEWNYLFLDLAREIAARKPVLIFLTLNGPKQPGEHQKNESGLLWLARELMSKGLAEWWPVNPLSREDVAAWLSPCAPGMIDHLRGVTGGNPRLLIKLFKDWQYRNIILHQDDKWVWNSNGSPAINLFKSVLEDRLKVLLKGDGWQESQGMKRYNETADLLACAALEGSVFTAEAIARTLNRDPDEVVDLLDDVLVQSSEQQLGIITEVASLTIADQAGRERPIWRYAFVSSLYVAAAREFRRKEELATLALALAYSLIESYSPEEKQIAPKLASLFRIGGDMEKALHFQRMADYAMMREGLHQHALYILGANKDDWDEWACNQAAALLLETGLKIIHAYPHDETMAFFEEAYIMAHRSGLQFEQASAVFHCGALNFSMGNFAIAGEKTEKAQTLFQKLNNRVGVAASLHQLGLLEFRIGNYQSARGNTQQALEIQEDIGDLRGQAGTLHLLGLIEIENGNYESAREYTKRAFEIDKEIGQRYVHLYSLHQLGSIEVEIGNYESARPYFQLSLEIAEEMGDRVGVAASLHQLGLLELRIGNYESARPYFQLSLEIAEEMGDRHGVAVSSLQLGSIELHIGNYESAREYTKRAFEIDKEIGQRYGQAASLHQLGLLELRIGNYETAREYTRLALEIEVEMGNRRGQAASMYQLGTIELRIGNYETAREYTRRALEIEEGMGNRCGQVWILHQLGSIEAEIGNYELAQRYAQRGFNVSEGIEGTLERSACLDLMNRLKEATKSDEAGNELDTVTDSEDGFQRGGGFE